MRVCLNGKSAVPVGWLSQRNIQYRQSQGTTGKGQAANWLVAPSRPAQDKKQTYYVVQLYQNRIEEFELDQISSASIMNRVSLLHLSETGGGRGKNLKTA